MLYVQILVSAMNNGNHHKIDQYYHEDAIMQLKTIDVGNSK